MLFKLVSAGISAMIMRSSPMKVGVTVLHLDLDESLSPMQSPFGLIKGLNSRSSKSSSTYFFGKVEGESLINASF